MYALGTAKHLMESAQSELIVCVLCLLATRTRIAGEVFRGKDRVSFRIFARGKGQQAFDQGDVGLSLIWF